MPGNDLTLNLGSNTYPILQIRSARRARDEIPGLRTGKLLFDQTIGAFRFIIDDFSAPWGQDVIDMQSDLQGHRYATLIETMDGAAGHLVCAPLRTSRKTGAAASDRVTGASLIGLTSVVEDEDGNPYAYMGLGNTIWRSDQGAVTFPAGGNPIVTVTGATQIGGIIETRDETGGRRLWVAGVAQSSDIDMRTMTSAGTWSTLTGTNGEGESICAVRVNSEYPSTLGSDFILYATKDGTIRSAMARVISNTPAYQRKITQETGRVQFLAQRFDSINTSGVWLIAGGRLRNLVFESGFLQPGGFRYGPQYELPPLVTGCMFQGTPAVTDGYTVFRALGAEIQEIGLPSGILTDVNRIGSSSFRLTIRALAPAGNLLIAACQVTDGTNYHMLVLAYNPSSGQWKVIHTIDGTTNKVDPMGMAYGPLSVEGDPNQKQLLIAYQLGGGTDLASVHLPRGLVGESLAQDEFETTSHWVMSEFTAGDLGLEKTILGYKLDVRLTENHASHAVKIQDGMDNAAYADVSGGSIAGDGGLGFRSTGDVLLASGQGEAAKGVAVRFVATRNTATAGPEIHRFEYIFNMQQLARGQWEIVIDTAEWLGANHKGLDDLWAQLKSDSDNNPQLTASVSPKVIASTFVKLKDFWLESPTDPMSKRLGPTHLILERSVA